ncbi:hypothetical protein ACI7RC_00730 [Brevibacillus sp. B_LB10_24]|uniref:hypothetical protein n=1 Tax=Brevibacillus sp. B_LB10_24 TaxID=3380645 RepID=UPI0038BA7117
MHYYGNETVMSLEQAMDLKPNEIRVLEWVRTYEFLENQYGLDDPVHTFLEIKCEAAGVRVRKNRITCFPDYICEAEEHCPDAETALPVFKRWAEEILSGMRTPEGNV